MANGPVRSDSTRRRVEPKNEVTHSSSYPAILTVQSVAGFLNAAFVLVQLPLHMGKPALIVDYDLDDPSDLRPRHADALVLPYRRSSASGPSSAAWRWACR